MNAVIWSTTAARHPVRAGSGTPGGGSATTPQPSAASSASRSGAPGGGFTNASGTIATRRERASPRTDGLLSVQGRLEPHELPALVVVEQVLADPDCPHTGGVRAEQLEQRLHEQTAARRHRVVLLARLVGPAAPLRARRRELDAHAGTAVDAQDHDPAPGRQVGPHLAGERRRQPPAVRAVRRRVVLLADRPEAARAAEGELGAGQLPERGAVPAQQLEPGHEDARATGALVDLRVGIQQAVGQVDDGAHPRTRTILPTCCRSSMNAWAAAASRSGKRRATGTAIRPSSAIARASRISSGVATRKPRIRWPRRKSSTMSSGTTSPAWAPQV